MPTSESRAGGEMVLVSVLVELWTLGTGFNWHALCCCLLCAYVFSLISRVFFRPCLLTPTSGGNRSHESAVDTDSVAITAIKQLLTPTSVPAFLPTALLQAIIQSSIQDARQAVSAARV